MDDKRITPRHIDSLKEGEIAPLFREASRLPNVTLPEGFLKILGQ